MDKKEGWTGNEVKDSCGNQKKEGHFPKMNWCRVSLHFLLKSGDFLPLIGQMYLSFFFFIIIMMLSSSFCLFQHKVIKMFNIVILAWVKSQFWKVNSHTALVRSECVPVSTSCALLTSDCRAGLTLGMLAFCPTSLHNCFQYYQLLDGDVTSLHDNQLLI